MGKGLRFLPGIFLGTRKGEPFDRKGAVFSLPLERGYTIVTLRDPDLHQAESTKEATSKHQDNFYLESQTSTKSKVSSILDLSCSLLLLRFFYFSLLVIFDQTL